MANTKSAAKRARQTVVRTKQNRRVTNAVKSSLKTLRSEVKSAVKEAATTALQKLSSVVDKAAKSGRIHPNKANRLKSRANKAVAKVA